MTLLAPHSSSKFGNQAWVGGRDPTEGGGQWQWVTDGQAFTWTHWAKNQPNNHKGRQHCLLVWKGMWNDEFCNRRRFYVCQMCK